MAGIQCIFGGAGLREGSGFGDLKSLPGLFEVLEKKGCKKIDTAALYGTSEELLGKSKAGDKFTLDTKARGGFGGDSTKQTVISEGKHSKELLGSDVDVYYLHAPDTETPLEETLEGVNEVYKTGFFKRFGLSNFKAEDVEKAYEICKAKGYPLPSVYQGNYSAVARKQEQVLFPTLRKLGMSFYAYSPIGGGFLTKTRKQVEDGEGRFSPEALGGMYAKMYGKESLLEALGQWEKIAKEEGISRAALAYRWVTYNSPLSREHGDGIIIGGRNVEQVAETLDAVNSGPLSESAVKKIDEIWKTIEHDAPLDNYHR